MDEQTKVAIDKLDMASATAIEALRRLCMALNGRINILGDRVDYLEERIRRKDSNGS